MKAILHDVSRCRGCMKCVERCCDERFDEAPLSATRRTTIARLGADRFVRQQCLHCLEPACASACLVGALHRTEEGPVVYDAEKCIGCRYCMLACPAEAVTYQWDRTLPFVRKCEMCYDRPGGPACVEACEYDATLYGDRDELLAIARERIAREPRRYVNRIWGESEMGGTGVLFISDRPLGDLWPLGEGKESIPDLTWPLASTTPALAVGVAGFLIATHWIIGRRNRLAEGGGHDA